MEYEYDYDHGYEELLNELDSERKRIDDLRQQLAAVEAERDRLAAELAHEKQDSDLLLAALANRDADVNELEAELETARGHLRAVLEEDTFCWILDTVAGHEAEEYLDSLQPRQPEGSE